MKSLEEIQTEFRDQRQREDAETIAKVREARSKVDALLQRAGIKDGPADTFADDAAKWKEEGYYRLRVREMVFKVPDGELHSQIMAKIDVYRFEVWERWEMLRLFDERFVERLRHERCCSPRFRDTPLATVPLAAMFLAYWFGDALDALVVGVGVVLPVLMFIAVRHISALHRRDLIMEEAVKFVERQEAVSRAEATRRLHLPELFSRREKRTGEVDEAQ